MTPEIQLATMFVLDRRGRIVSTREPDPQPAPRFMLIRGFSDCAWAVRADVAADAADEIERLALEEPPLREIDDRPINADKYVSLLGEEVISGPAFVFPDRIAAPSSVTAVERLELLERHFRGWTAAEIPERSPIMAVIEDGYPVSVCFCARLADKAAEAGVETAAPFRGRGYAPRVTAAWAAAIRRSGRIPLYSTSWSNTSSLAVARRLGLLPFASDWSVT